MMTPERWQEIGALFSELLELPAEAADERLEEVAKEDAELAAEVRSLLGAHRDAGEFIEEPVIRLGGSSLGEEPPGSPDTPTLVEGGLDRVGPYRLQEVIGRGGMGSVYAAVRADDEFEQRVAVKILQPWLADPELVRRFRGERQILANLEHPYIARLLDGGTTPDGRPYLVMEYVDGEPITDFCDRHRLSVDERVRLLIKVCRAVHFAHQRLVVHRDLKPGNILVTTDGEPKLLDFGIAKLLSPEEFPVTLAATGTGVAPMTPEWASPEQVRGERITTASDVYALGLLAYRLLCGVTPYRLSGERSLPRLMRAVCEQEPLRPSTAVREGGDDAEKNSDHLAEVRDTDPLRLARSLQGDLDTIVLHALNKDPQRRYGSVEQLARDMERHLDGLPVTARPDTLVYRVGKFVRRHRLTVGAASLALTLLLGTLAVLLVQRQALILQTERAQQVSSFLEELFEISDPSRSRGEQVTAREILERGAERIESELATQPGTLSHLETTIGRVYQSLGLYPESKPHLEIALKIARERFGDRSEEAARARFFLGHAAMNEGRYTTAEDLFRRAAESYGRAESTEQAQALAGRAKALRSLGRFDEAEPIYREALRRAETLSGPRSEEVADQTDELAGLLVEQGRYDEAGEAYDLALEIFLEHHGELHPRVCEVRLNRARLGVIIGELETSVAEIREVLEIQRQLFDEGHPSLSDTLHYLASAVHDQGRFQEAETLYRQTLELRRESYGQHHPKVASILNNLGQLEQDLRRLDEAETYLRDALEIWRSQLGPRHPEVAVGLNNLATLLHQKGELEEAEQQLEEALDIVQRAYGAQHREVATVLNNLGRIAHRRGQTERAAGLYGEALDILRLRLGESHPRVGLALHNVAKAHRDLKDWEKSETLYLEAIQVLQQSVGDEHVHTAVARHGLATMLLELERYQEAGSFAERALATYRQQLPEDHPWIAGSQRILATALAGESESSSETMK
ncbi:MAG: serine/threonine-protein kinase [Acidobacteriota bacterium]